jgi:hypothetical protein
LLVEEMCRRYKTWAHFFSERIKNQFIPLPWKIGEFIVKNIIHLDELACHFDQLGLKEAKFVKVFESDNKFIAHMDLISCSSHFTKIERFQEEGEDNLDIPEIAADQVSDNVKELTSTNEGY